MKIATPLSLRAFACTAVILAVVAYAPEAGARSAKRAQCQMLTEAKAKILFDEWNRALQGNPPDPDKVLLTYTPNALLLPTLESGPLVGRAQMRGYFVHFLELHPVGRIDTRAVYASGCNVGVAAGLYTFTVDEGGRRVDKPARYTYVYVYQQAKGGGRWLIQHHHSSVRPPAK
jgi:uncharacterized protein (TIGR02246 family)